MSSQTTQILVPITFDIDELFIIQEELQFALIEVEKRAEKIINIIDSIDVALSNLDLPLCRQEYEQRNLLLSNDANYRSESFKSLNLILDSEPVVHSVLSEQHSNTNGYN